MRKKFYNNLNVLIFFVSLIFIVKDSFAEPFQLNERFEEERSTHFIVFYQKGVDKDFIKEVVSSSEQYYEDIANNLGFRRYDFWLWDDRAKIYIFADKDSYQAATNQPEWTGGVASYKDKSLWTFPHAAGFFDSLLPHEMGHIIFREFVGYNTRIPLWFEEGIASFQEKSKRFAAASMVKQLIKENRLLSLEELGKIKTSGDIQDKQLAEAFYTEAISIVYFLINEFSKDKFVELCLNLKKNMGLDMAIANTYYNIRDVEDLYKRWMERIKSN